MEGLKIQTKTPESIRETVVIGGATRRMATIATALRGGDLPHHWIRSIRSPSRRTPV